jgi:ribosomal protein L7/L12
MVKNYEISEYSYRKAKELNVELRQAENKHKKIGVWKNGKHVVDIGAKNYKDYPTYLAMEQRGEVPKGYANERKRLYKLRHKYDRGEAGFYANKILW